MKFLFRKLPSNRGLLSGGMIFVLLLAFAGGIVILSPSVFGQETDAVSLEVDLAQTVFKVAEPLVAHAALVNPREDAIQIDSLSLELATISYSIQSGDGPFEVFFMGVVEEPFAPSQELEAGGVERADQLIHFNHGTNALAFPVPGNYTLKVEYTGFLSVEPRPATVEIAIEVVANDREDAEAEALFSRSSTGDFLTDQSRNPDVIRQLIDLIANRPDSLFSLYARFFLALHEARDFPDKPRDLRAAVDLMSGADQAGFQLQPEVILQLGDWTWFLGDAVAGFAFLDRVIADFPGSSAAAAAGALKEEREGLRPPPPPPLEGESIEPGPVRDAIEAALNSYFDAVEALNATAALAVLADDFLFNRVLDKTNTRAQLQEDFDELAGSGELTIDRTINTLEMVGTTAVADVDVTPVLDGTPIATTTEVQIQLVLIGEDWFLQSWNVLN